MECYNIKSLKKYRANSLCSIIGAVLALVTVVVIVVLTVSIMSKTFPIKNCAIFLFGVLLIDSVVLTILSSKFEWYINAKLEKKHGRWFISYSEALGFLGISQRTEVEIKELTGYIISKGYIEFFGKFKTHEQMSGSKKLKKVKITGIFEDREKAEKLLKELTGYIQEEDIIEPEYEDIKETSNEKEFKELSEEELETMIEEYKQEKETENRNDTEDYVVNLDDLNVSVERRKFKRER